MQTRMIIFLEWLLPAISSDLPKAGGPRQRFCSVLLRMGFTYAPPVTRKAVVSYTAFHPYQILVKPESAVYFCCTFLGVASTGRYPAFCPVKPGLSSPAVFRHLQPRSFVLLILKTERTPQKLWRTLLNIHYSFNFRKKIFSQENFFRQNFHCFYTLKQLPPINSRRMEFWLIPSLGIGRK